MRLSAAFADYPPPLPSLPFSLLPILKRLRRYPGDNALTRSRSRRSHAYISAYILLTPCMLLMALPGALTRL